MSGEFLAVVERQRLGLTMIVRLLSAWCASVLLLAAHDCATAETQDWDALTFHAAPKPLPDGAVTADWPRFLGPGNHPVSSETKLDHALPAEGPKKVWEVSKGSGYACPAIAGGKVVLFHRVADRETVDCLEPETGKRFWTFSYPVVYSDRYGYGNGPRASPVVDDGRVYTIGVTAILTSLDLASGRVHWQRNAAKEDGVPQYFFGTGSTPLVHGDVVVVDLGGSEGKEIVGFDKTTGAVKWTAKTGWKASYASPMPATLHGKSRVLVFQGGEGEESTDSTGGLVSIDPQSGKIDDSFFWRARRYTSVNASSPVLCGADRVFISQAYIDADSPANGGVMIAIGDDMKMKPLWKDEHFACHWMTPVFHDGHLYAFSGEKDRQAELVCYEAATGTCKWRTRLEHEAKLGDGRPLSVGLMRGSLLRVDGSFLALGEWGTLCWLDLSPAGCVRKSCAQLFTAPYGGWTLPALSRGLLYVCQNEEDRVTGAGRRLICYDLRGDK
jgi:outer membrane protein assembly factor BamB